MNMTVHPAPQGSEQWLADRAERYNAGDAAAVLGCDVNGRTRNDILDALVNGFTPEVGAFKQRLYDKGHEVEAMARPLAEAIVGEDLYPLVGSIEVPGLSRRLGASFDGLTMPRDTNFECKSLNEALAEALPVENDPDANDAGNLPKGYRVQPEQQLMVSGAERVLFCAAAFNPDGTTQSFRACWYRSDPELREEILAGWRQLDADLPNHVPKAHQEAPRGERVEALPMLVVQVEGRIVSSNLAIWREGALAHIASINKDLKTDDDFANAKEAVKWCKESADKLKLLKEQTLAQMVDVNELITTMDKIVGGLDRTRLDLDSLVTTRETAIRQEVARRGEQELADHLAKLIQRIGKPYMPAATHPFIAADFQKAIKSKRTVKSLNDSVDAEVARCKIAASAVADRIAQNVKFLDDECDDFKALFPDEKALVLKECDDFKAVVLGRVNEHKAAEQKRLDAERETIRQEEQAKAEKAAREKLEAEQAEARRQEQQREQEASEAAKPTQPPAAAPIAPPASAPQAAAANSPPPAGNVSPLRSFASAGAPSEQPTLSLGDMNVRLGFTMNSAFVRQLGIAGTPTPRAGVSTYRESEFDLLCESLVAHVRTVSAKRLEAA